MTDNPFVPEGWNPPPFELRKLAEAALEKWEREFFYGPDPNAPMPEPVPPLVNCCERGSQAIDRYDGHFSIEADAGFDEGGFVFDAKFCPWCGQEIKP